MTITEILNYLLGSTTLVSIYIAWSSRKAEIKKAETGALEGMQTVYDKFVEQTEKEFIKLREIINIQDNKIKELEKNIKENICKSCEKK